MKPYYDKHGITIYHADCRDVLTHLAPGSIDLCVTDSAYKIISGGNTTKRMMGGIFHPSVYNNNGNLFPTLKFSEWIPQVYAVLKDDSDFYSMVNDKNVYGCQDAAFKAGFELHNILVWHKQNKTPNQWYMKSCEFTLYFWKGDARQINDMGSDQYSNAASVKNRKHKTQKPVALMAEYIANSSQPNDVVIDPFMGVGSTLIAAKQLGRRAIGCEINEQDCETAALWLDRATYQHDTYQMEMTTALQSV